MEGKRIGQVIHDRRVELKMSLEDVARAMGTTKATVSRWESGVVKTIKHPQIQLLSKVLFLPIDAILGEDGTPIEDSEIVIAKNSLKQKIDAIQKLETIKQVDSFVDFLVTTQK